MNTDTLITKLAAEVAARVKPTVPIEIALWSKESISAYLDEQSKSTVDRYINLPDFPKPARIKHTRGRGNPLWRAREVIDWFEGHFPKKG